MASAKVVNYSAEQEQVLREGVASGKAIETLAQELGKTVRSVIAKLSRMGLYEAKTAKTQATKKQTKMDLIAEIAAHAGLEKEVLASFEKADKTALEALLQRM